MEKKLRHVVVGTIIKPNNGLAYIVLFSQVSIWNKRHAYIQKSESENFICRRPSNMQTFLAVLMRYQTMTADKAVEMGVT